MNAASMRRDLVELLKGGSAHASVESALKGIPREARGKRVKGLRSIWEELEHLRLAQEDILRFTLDASWKSPEWPAGYWPEKRANVPDGVWRRSVSGFFADLDEVAALVSDEARDLTAPIPHGEGRTYLREVLLVADHNAYHLAQIVQLRKLLGAWKG